MAGLQALTAPVVSFLTQSTWARRQGEADLMDFVVGNPHELPLPEFVHALRQQLEPRANDWFAYQMSDPTACAAVAGGLRSRLGIPFEAKDVLMTTGAFAGLSVSLRALIDPGRRGHLYQPALVLLRGANRRGRRVPVRVSLQAPAFAVDPDAIADAIHRGLAP